MRPPGVIFVNRFYFPDMSATSQMLTELSSDLAADFPITVVTSRMLSNDAGCSLQPRERIGRVEVHRVWTSRLGRASLWRRAVDYLSFHLSVALFLLRRVQRDDVVVLKTDPPLMPLLNTPIIRWKGGKVVNWLQDIYPEIALRLGSFPGPRWLCDALAGWRDHVLKKAAANVVISTRMAEYLAQRGLDEPDVIANWADGDDIRPLAHENNPLRKAWGLEGKFTVMYSGNFGRAHAFSEIAEAVRQLAAEPRVHFVFIGDGAGLEPLMKSLAGSGAANFSCKPFQPREMLRNSLGAADLHLVSLKAGMEDLVMPSKLYGIMAAGRPMVFIGDRGGATAAMIEREQAGCAVALGDGADLARRIGALARDPERTRRYGVNARAVFEREFTRARASGRWRALLRKVSIATVSR